MGSQPQHQPPSCEASTGSSQHLARFSDTPSTVENYRDDKTNDNFERRHSCPSIPLTGTSKDTVPRRLPETPFFAPTSSGELKPEKANGTYLAILPSKLSTLNLNPELFLSWGLRVALKYSLLETDSSAPSTVHNEPPFQPYQLGNPNRPADTSTAENASHSSNSTIKSALVTRSTNRTTRKRNTPDDRQEEEEEEGDCAGDGDDHAPHNSGKVRPLSSSPMACPYRKRKYKKFSFHTHPKCTEPFADMTAVKQHLIHKHMLSASQLESHNGQNFEDGITQDIERRLSAREHTSRVNTWEKLWTLLFNETSNIPSPDYEPCHIFEEYEVRDLMKQHANRLSQHQAPEPENIYIGPPTQDTFDDAVNHTMSTYLASRDPGYHTTESARRKTRGKQKAKPVNTSEQTNASQGAISHSNHTFRTIASRTTASNTPDQLLPRPSAQAPRLPFQSTAHSISPFDPTPHGGASYTINSPSDSLRRSARLTPQLSQMPHSAYPPVPGLKPWNGNGRDVQQFHGYNAEFGWTPNADDIAEDLNEDDGQI